MIASVEMYPQRPTFFRRTTRSPGRQRVRRAIFRTQEDINESLEYVRREQEALSVASRERWNFDFDSGLPIEGGRYEWQSVSQQASTTTSSEETEVSRHTENFPEQTSSTDDTIRRSQHLKQTKISDFWKHRKRHYSSPIPDTQKTTTEVATGCPAKVQRASSS